MTGPQGPWLKYQQQAPAADQSGPWTKYASPSAPEVPTSATPAPVSDAAADTASSVLKLYAPNFVKNHPTIAGIIGGAGDFLQGGGRELIGQGVRLAQYASPRGGAALKRVAGDYTTPLPGAAQSLGRLGVDAGEALELPGVEGPLALRVPAQALLGAGLSKLQGGSALAGAAGGGGAELVGSALRAAAPSLAEGAAGITDRMRKFGRRPGEDILEYTRGLRPSTVRRSAEQAIGDVDAQRAGMLKGAMGAGKTVDTTPALSVPMEIADKLTLAKAPTKAVDDVAGYLNQFPSRVTPEDAQRMQFGLKSQGWTNFNRLPGGPSEVPLDVQAGMGARAALENGLEAAMPGYRKLGNREGSLIAAKNALSRREIGAGLGQRVGDRAAARTGALASAILGAQAGGPAGAIIAPILQEASALPATRLAIARGAYSPVTKRLLRGALVGGATAATKH